MLTRQIENGAPMDLFAAANVELRRELEQKGLIIPDTKAIYARGRITLWTPTDSHSATRRHCGPRATRKSQRIAIANPDHAPYGLAATPGAGECRHLGAREAEARLRRQHSTDTSVCARRETLKSRSWRCR